MLGATPGVSFVGNNTYVSKYSDPDLTTPNPAALGYVTNNRIFISVADKCSGQLLDCAAGFNLNKVELAVNYAHIPNVTMIETQSTNNRHEDTFDWISKPGKNIEQLNILLSGAFKGTQGTTSLSMGGGAGPAIVLGEFGTVGFLMNFGLMLDVNNVFTLSSAADFTLGGGVGLLWGICLMNAVKISPVKHLNIFAGNISFVNDEMYSDDTSLWRFGAEYSPVERLTLRLGTEVQHKSWAITSGIGYRFGDSGSIDYAFKKDALAGYDHSATAIINLKKKAKPVQGTQTAGATALPAIKKPHGPIEVNIEDNKYLTVTAGWGFFKFSRAQMSDLTGEGISSIQNARKLISYLYSLGLCDTEAKVKIEGNSSKEGRPFVNDTLSSNRALMGKQFLIETIGKGPDIELKPLAESRSIVLEESFILDWAAQHNGDYPPTDELEAFRQGCRNFKIIISIKREQWKAVRENPEVIGNINKLSAGLAAKLESAYQSTPK
jgi:hypothetical protein